jgi:hypothetical protein
MNECATHVFVFQYDVPCLPLYFDKYCLLSISSDLVFVSVWALDSGLIVLSWSRDSIRPQNAYLQVDDMREYDERMSAACKL